MAQGISVFNVNLMERVCHLTNKIYREMLSITRHDKIMYITMGGLDHVQVRVSPTPQYRIVLSWDLLSWIAVEGRIPCSFTNFITTPELSGPFKLYISPDTYHTQIAEYFARENLSVSSFLSALNILPDYYSADPSITFLFWTGLELWGTLSPCSSNSFRSVLVNATDKPLRLKIRFVSRDLAPRDRATCTIASRIYFFNTKSSPSTLT